MAHPDTEHDGPELADVISSQAGLAAEIPLKVHDSRLIDHSYNWKGKEVKQKKFKSLSFPSKPIKIASASPS